uniref:Uncharacterized protein n=1 Tax=Arundo donax TaxID=35708 RepID=A0A0A9G2L3_ARUDO
MVQLLKYLKSQLKGVNTHSKQYLRLLFGTKITKRDIFSNKIRNCKGSFFKNKTEVTIPM